MPRKSLLLFCCGRKAIDEETTTIIKMSSGSCPSFKITYVSCAFSVAFDKASVCLVPSLSPVDANMQSLLTTRMQHTQTLQ